MRYLLSFLLLWPIIGQATTSLNAGDLYFGTEAEKRIESVLAPDTVKGYGFYLIKMRWKSTVAFYTTYGCTVASLNEWVAAAPNLGTTSLYNLINLQTPNGEKWTWDNLITLPASTMDPWCLIQ